MKHHDLVRSALTIDDELDDIKRARIWSRLEDQLEEPEARRARWPIMLGVSAVAAIAVLALVRMTGTTTNEHARILAVPADTTVTANLGPFTRAALVGPAELEFVDVPGDATTVRLRRGTLLAEFTGAPGRSLRVEAPGATVEIVGTLFAIEARAGGSCTSVAHGRVRVITAAGDVFVGATERYCTAEGATPQPIDDEVKRALERHGGVITAQGAPPSSAIAAAPTTTVEPTAVAPVPTAPATSAPSTTAPTTTAPAPAASVSTGSAPTRAPTTSSRAPNSRARDSRAPTASASPGSALTASAPSSSPRAAVTAVAPEPVAPRAPQPSAEPVAAPVVTPSAVRPPAPTAPPPPPTADDLYRTAEAALVTGDLAAADRALDRVLVAFPSSALVDQALYERARIAYQQRAWATARRHLDKLATLPRSTLAEPGAYLACRIAVETRDGGAVSCLVEYRKAFPRSPHDLEALSLVIKLTHASGGCAGVAPQIDELVRRHPTSKHAAAWRARCPERP